VTTPRSEPENREGEEDYPSLCPQCGQAAKDSRFCPYCGHDKIEEESFGSLLQERQEALKRERLHNERWGRSVLGLFLFSRTQSRSRSRSVLPLLRNPSRSSFGLYRNYF
jgi:hypothetical protein